MVDRRSVPREGRMAEGSVYDIEKQAWNEARAKGNKYHQMFQKRYSSGFINPSENRIGAVLRNCARI